MTTKTVTTQEWLAEPAGRRDCQERAQYWRARLAEAATLADPWWRGVCEERAAAWERLAELATTVDEHEEAKA